jgi:hypothetical protein
MKTVLFISFLTALFYSCGQNSKSGTMSNSPITSQKSNSIIDTNSSLVVIDSSFYSVSFLKSLEPQKANWKFSLDSDMFIFNNLDTILFPDLVPFNKAIFLTGKKGDLRINLYVKRILISTIDYKIEVIKNNNPPAIKSGLADLSPYFFVQSKTDEIDSTIYSTETTEYWDNSTDYLTSIRIGNTRDNKTMLIAKVECKLKTLVINQDNCPTLIEK